MRRFTFRLERIRQLRERAERERAAELGLAVREELTCTDDLARADRDFERAGQGAAEVLAAGTLPAGTLASFDLVRDAVARRIDDGEQALQAARGRVGEERVRHGEARRDLRVVERLKERRLQTWRGLEAREEQKESDGVTLNRHATKKDRT